MTHRILLSFLGICLLAPSWAETTVYGSINTGWEYSQTRANDRPAVSGNGITDRGSYVGLRGSWTLDSQAGTDRDRRDAPRIIWQVEQDVDTGNPRPKRD